MRKNFFNNKSGGAHILVGIVFIVGLLLMGMFFLKVDPKVKEIYSKVTDNYLEHNVSKEIVNNNRNDYSDIWDGAFMFLFCGLWLASLILGYYHDYGRMIMVFMILFMIILLIGAGVLTNYWERTSDEGFNMATEADYPMTYFLLDNLLLSCLVVVASGIIVSYISDRR